MKILVILAVTLFVLSGCLPCCVPGRKNLKAADTVGEATLDWGRGEIYVMVDEGKSDTKPEKGSTSKKSEKRKGFTCCGI